MEFKIHETNFLYFSPNQIHYIGTDKKNIFHPQSKYVSRHHAALRRIGDSNAFELIDFFDNKREKLEYSKNGVWVYCKKGESLPLEDGLSLKLE